MSAQTRQTSQNVSIQVFPLKQSSSQMRSVINDLRMIPYLCCGEHFHSPRLWFYCVLAVACVDLQVCVVISCRGMCCGVSDEVILANHVSSPLKVLIMQHYLLCRSGAYQPRFLLAHVMQQIHSLLNLSTCLHQFHHARTSAAFHARTT